MGGKIPERVFNVFLSPSVRHLGRAGSVSADPDGYLHCVSDRGHVKEIDYRGCVENGKILAIVANNNTVIPGEGELH